MRFYKILIVLMIQRIFADESNSIVSSNSAGDMISIEVIASQGKPGLQAHHFLSNSNETFLYSISHPERELVSFPVMEMISSGESVALWQSFNTTTNMIVLEATAYSKDLGWSSPKILSEDFEKIEPGIYQLYLYENGLVRVFWSDFSDDETQKISKTVILKISDLFNQ